MKAIFPLVALAVTALAQDIVPRNDWPKSVTQTVITTTTVCPITSTYTEHGKTSIVTYLTTSTLTITNCPGGQCGGVVTIPGPTGVASSTTQVLTTYTTICLVTETITAPGTTYTKVYTTTSTVVTHVEQTVDVTKTLPDVTTSALSYVYSTSTSYCPVTETKTVSGQLVTVVYTSTSLIVTKVPQTIEQTTTLAPATKTIETFVYSYSTSYCPVTTVSTVSGKEVTVVYTSTSLVQVQVPTTIVQYTTALTTCYLTTQVYQTTTCYTTDYTTVSKGSTIVIPVTETQTIKVTNAYTVTSTYEPPTVKATVSIPITLATSIGYTEVVTVPSEQTATTQGGVVYSTISYSTQATVTAPPATVSIPPTTSIIVPSSTAPRPSVTTSAPVQVTAAAAPTNRPIAMALAGVMAVLAFA